MNTHQGAGQIILMPSINRKAFDKVREGSIFPKRVEAGLEEVGLRCEAECEAERPRSYADETRVKLIVDMHEVFANRGYDLRDGEGSMHGDRGRSTTTASTATDRFQVSNN